jgi:hypothetical protein
MSDQSNGITFHTIQEAMPEDRIAADLVRGILAAMQPPAGVSHAWRRERVTRGGTYFGVGRTSGLGVNRRLAHTGGA